MNDNSGEIEDNPSPDFVLSPLPPEVTEGKIQAKPHRKSITWSIESHDSANSSGSNPPKSPNVRQSLRARAIPKIRRSKHKSLANRRSSSNSWLKHTLCPSCCTAEMDSDSDDVEYDDFTPKKMRGMDEDEIVARLQQAVYHLQHRPTNYEIDAEILKYHRTLEIEQRQYEESGRPKFKYIWFRKNQYLAPKKHPLYGTNYENHRKLEVRLEEFRFGAGSADADSHNEQAKAGPRTSYESKDSTLWRTEAQVLYANLALLTSASNFLRFPQACYANGGFTFLLTYSLMIACIGQPLLYFEMVLGQFSLQGPNGFARLHPYAKGLPYAIAFVCVVFGASKAVFLAYSLLYSLLSIIASPGDCGWWGHTGSKCVPYKSFEKHADLLKEERQHMMKYPNDTEYVKHVHAFSVELYFREVMLEADWLSGEQVTFLHWRLIIAYILVCVIALIPVSYNIGGKTMKRYLRNCSIIIPSMILIVFIDQISRRRAIYQATQYFISVDREHVSALSIWSEAFEMVLSTLGIGYGFHWFISGNISMDFKDTYRISWRICGCAVIFGIISSLVVFCEIGIVGKLIGGDTHYHVFLERLGISFVCYSGALYKVSGNSVLLIFLFFLLFVFYGMWSQIIVADIILRWVEHGEIIKGPVRRIISHRKKTTLVILIAFQLFVMSPYFFSKGGAILASENIFGGALAAYVVVLAELIVAGYLYGFAKFFADLEIMAKRPISAVFHFQIRYVGIPTIVIFMIPMILNVYIFPSIYVERNHLGWLFYFGLLINFAPVLIILLAIPWSKSGNVFFKPKKVTPGFLFPYGPRHWDSSALEEIRKQYPVMEPTFVAKNNCPSQQGHGPTIRSEIYQMVEHNMEFVHKCQDFVKTQFLKLLRFKVNQRRWIKLYFGVVGSMQVASMRNLVCRIMIARKYRNDGVDVDFLKEALYQIVNLTFSSAIRKLQRMPMQEMLLYMADELLKLTAYRIPSKPYNVLTLSSSSSSSSSSSEDSTNTESLDDDPLKVHGRLVGPLEKSSEEYRTLLTIRLKRGLNLPHEVELSVLRFLRRQRAKIEREHSCWTQRDKLPVDHFIPSSISNNEKEKICFTIFHAVVVEGGSHYVLKRLPVPRPPVVRVTKRFVQSQPGNTLTDKFAHIVTRRMHRNIGRILEKRNLKDMSKNHLKRHLWKLADRVDDDVYDFLDRILTCVIVVLSDSEVNQQDKLPMYLTPRTRRKSIAITEHTPYRRRALTEYEISSYAALNRSQLQQQYWADLLQDSIPPDIKYHSDSSSSLDSPGEVDDSLLDLKSSSGSTSTLTPDAVSDVEEDYPSSNRSSIAENSMDIAALAEGTLFRLPSRIRSQFMLDAETLQHRDNRLLLRKAGFGVVGLPETPSDLAVCVTAEKIKHISARRWKHARDSMERKGGESLWYSENEIRLQGDVEVEANKAAQQTLASKSMEVLKSTRRVKESQQQRQGGIKKAVSLESIRHLLESQAEFKVDLTKGQIVAIAKDRVNWTRAETKLRNTNEELIYFAYGKTLIVDHGVKLSSVLLSKFGRLRSTISHRSEF